MDDNRIHARSYSEYLKVCLLAVCNGSGLLWCSRSLNGVFVRAQGLR